MRTRMLLGLLAIMILIAPAFAEVNKSLDFSFDINKIWFGAVEFKIYKDTPNGKYDKRFFKERIWAAKDGIDAWILKAFDTKKDAIDAANAYIEEAKGKALKDASLQFQVDVDKLIIDDTKIVTWWMYKPGVDIDINKSVRLTSNKGLFDGINLWPFEKRYVPVVRVTVTIKPSSGYSHPMHGDSCTYYEFKWKNYSKKSTAVKEAKKFKEKAISQALKRALIDFSCEDVDLFTFETKPQAWTYPSVGTIQCPRKYIGMVMVVVTPDPYSITNDVSDSSTTYYEFTEDMYDSKSEAINAAHAFEDKAIGIALKRARIKYGIEDLDKFTYESTPKTMRFPIPEFWKSNESLWGPMLDKLNTTVN